MEKYRRSRVAALSLAFHYYERRVLAGCCPMRSIPAVDPNATVAPAPPAVTYLSPIIPLITIGTNGPINNYGFRNGNVYPTSGAGMACSSG